MNTQKDTTKNTDDVLLKICLAKELGFDYTGRMMRVYSCEDVMRAVAHKSGNFVDAIGKSRVGMLTKDSNGNQKIANYSTLISEVYKNLHHYEWLKVRKGGCERVDLKFAIQHCGGRYAYDIIAAVASKRMSITYIGCERNNYL